MRQSKTYQHRDKQIGLFESQNAKGTERGLRTANRSRTVKNENPINRDHQGFFFWHKRDADGDFFYLT